MRVRCRYPTQMLRKIETAMKADNWKDAKQQSRILLSHLLTGGELPRMEYRRRKYVLKGYLRHIIELPEATDNDRNAKP